MGAGDSYNRRFDAIPSKFVQKERCVDDMVFWDNDIASHWRQSIKFLSTAGRAGIVLNPDKFQFCQQEINFGGFRISLASISPLPKYLNAIKDFLRPVNITDVCSWFGLINQVSAYGQLRPLMAPFHHLLSSKAAFAWSHALESAFNSSKAAIVKAIKQGVDIFDPFLPMCLRTDWSEGLRYHLLQKTCSCLGATPLCCDTRWRITLAVSRFNNGAELRYAPIKGEALAIAWVLEQTRYFTQGCNRLVIATNHKPLVALLGSKPLESVTNPGLFRLKQRTGLWKFDIVHLLGKSNSFAKVTSCQPAGCPVTDQESTLILSASASIAISASDVAMASAQEPEYWQMISALRRSAAN